MTLFWLDRMYEHERDTLSEDEWRELFAGLRANVENEPRNHREAERTSGFRPQLLQEAAPCLALTAMAVSTCLTL